MATMNVSLPDAMKEWVEAKASSGRYSNASDYVRDLIRRDQDREAKIAEMQRLVTEGLESGIGDRSMTELLEVDGYWSVYKKHPHLCIELGWYLCPARTGISCLRYRRTGNWCPGCPGMPG